MDPTLTASIAIGLAVFLVVIVAALLAQRVADKREIATLQVDRNELQGDYEALSLKNRELGREIAELRAKEQKRQDQRVAASRSGHAKRAAARIAANGAA